MGAEIFHPGDSQRGCYQKKRYPTEEIARKIANQREWEGAPPLRVYGCLECGGYHLTRKIEPNNRGGRRGG